MKSILMIVASLFLCAVVAAPSHAQNKSVTEFEESLKVLSSEDIHRMRKILIGIGSGDIDTKRDDVRLEFHQIVDRIVDAQGNQGKGKDYFLKSIRRGFVAMNPYIKRFWLDALLSLKEGRVIRSVETIELEEKYLREGLLNKMRIEKNETLLRKVARKESMIVKGWSRTIDEHFIVSTLNNIDGATKRYEWLFSD